MTGSRSQLDGEHCSIPILGRSYSHLEFQDTTETRPMSIRHKVCKGKLVTRPRNIRFACPCLPGTRFKTCDVQFLWFPIACPQPTILVRCTNMCAVSAPWSDSGFDETPRWPGSDGGGPLIHRSVTTFIATTVGMTRN